MHSHFISSSITHAFVSSPRELHVDVETKAIIEKIYCPCLDKFTAD